MRIDVFTIFPGMLEGRSRQSLLGRAIARGRARQVWVHDLRTFATDAHHQVDDTSFGGGPGMVMKAEPVFAAVESLDPDRGRVVLLSPAGRRLDQALVRELAAEAHLTLRLRALRRAWTSVSSKGFPPRKSRSATTCCPVARCRRSC